MLCLLGQPALALLARVALSDRSQERRALAELLFHEAADPRDSLRWHLSYLRARLPDALVVERNAVSARIPTDVAAFRAGALRILDDPAAPDAPLTLALYRGNRVRMFDSCRGICLCGFAPICLAYA